jgi:hypothetical protein
VARILNPIVLTLEKLEDLQDIEGLGEYVQGTFGGVEQCRKDILRKFFFLFKKPRGDFRYVCIFQIT